jgi:ectoine hydroxylase-related dioxygenase (phytanoyl-CoA dioxygenase family)
MLNEEQIARFDTDGFLNAGPLLEQDEVEELRSELDRVLETGPDGFAEGESKPVSFRDLAGEGGVSEHPVWQIVNIWEASEAFERLLYHPAITGAFCQLSRQSDIVVWHDQLQYKPAGTGGALAWHQDAPLWPIIKPMTSVSAWIPLDDVDEENGCMWMVPGSYQWGDQIAFIREHLTGKEFDNFQNITAPFVPPEGAQVAEAVPRPWPMKRGELSFHHSLNWHGSPANQSNRDRRAIAIHYMTGETRYDASGDHLMKEFVEVADGDLMSGAGAHFPVVCRGGEPVAPPSGPNQI